MPQNLSLAQSEFFLAFYPKYLRLLGSCLRSQLSNKMAARRMIMQNIVRQIKVPRLLQDWTNSLEMFTEEIFSRYRFRWATILFICSLVENALKHPTNKGSPLPPLLQVLVALRFYATGAFYKLPTRWLFPSRRQDELSEELPPSSLHWQGSMSASPRFLKLRRYPLSSTI